MFDIATNVSTVLGTEEEMAFKREADSGEIVYTRGAITSSVTLECTPNAKTSLLYAPPDMKDQVVSEIETFVNALRLNFTRL